MWMFGAADDAAVFVIVPEVELSAWQYWIEAAPAVDFAGLNHANPDLALVQELFTVASLRLGAACFVVRPCVFSAIAPIRYAGASTGGAYLSHQTVTVSYEMWNGPVYWSSNLLAQCWHQ